MEACQLDQSHVQALTGNIKKICSIIYLQLLVSLLCNKGNLDQFPAITILIYILFFPNSLYDFSLLRWMDVPQVNARQSITTVGVLEC